MVWPADRLPPEGLAGIRFHSATLHSLPTAVIPPQLQGTVSRLPWLINLFFSLGINWN